MRTLGLLLLLLLSASVQARESRTSAGVRSADGARLLAWPPPRPSSHPLPRWLDPPPPLDSDASLRVQDMIRRAQNTLMDTIERVQHFGSYRTWVWVMPFDGTSVGGAAYGASVRFDLR